MTMTAFVDNHTSENVTTYIGFKSMPYATLYWLVDGVRQYKTKCYTSAELVNAVINRTQLTNGLTFDVEYPATGGEM